MTSKYSDRMDSYKIPKPTLNYRPPDKHESRSSVFMLMMKIICTVEAEQVWTGLILEGEETDQKSNARSFYLIWYTISQPNS